MTDTARYLIVSNRLPVTVSLSEDAFSLTPSAGGLATALKQVYGQNDSLWIGWPGDTNSLDVEQRGTLDHALHAANMVPVHLEPQQVERFYEGFSNGVLWPLFHYLLEKVRLDAYKDWEAYQEVNERFAQQVAECYQPGDRIWVHDYQLMLVPGLLRQKLPQASIGFFLHIPFAAASVFRILPWRRELLKGLLGADIVGFHTYSYQRHFASCLLRLLGLDTDVDIVEYEGRKIRVGAYPISIDTAYFEEASQKEGIAVAAQEIRTSHQNVKLLLGVDRLDYTKGLLRRVLAIERLLEKHPDLSGQFQFIQIAAPSREGVAEYETLRRQIDELIGRVNGRFSTLSWSPVQYLYRNVSHDDLLALYRAADVMLVTPLRDGMNLVAKEYVACQHDNDGVLVLSEFAGAAWEMGEAIITNPYDIEELADKIHEALTLPEDDRRLRMKMLRDRVRRWTVHDWVRAFDADFAHMRTVNEAMHQATALSQADTQRIIHARHLRLVLDYDGTLVPFAATPQLAAPDKSLLDLLKRLTKRPNTKVGIASGRDRETLSRWFQDLDISIHAEHGFWHRPSQDAEWLSAAVAGTDWKGRAREIMNTFAARTPGSLVEEKTASLCWHYRRCEPHFAVMQQRELLMHLSDLFRNQPVEVLLGSKVVELRQIGVHKGLVISQHLAETPLDEDHVLVVVGDDVTDEDMFRQLPSEGIGIHVGPGKSAAHYRLATPAAVRDLLQQIAASS